MINIFKKLFNTNASPFDVPWIDNPCWIIKRVPDVTLFFKHIMNLIPANSIMEIKSDVASDGILSFYRANSISTQGPFDSFQLLVNSDLMDKLIQISDNHAGPEYCDNLLIYLDNKLILHWYDFPGDPIHISPDIDEAKVDAFSQNIKATLIKK